MSEHVINNANILQNRSNKDEEMPNHMIVRTFSSIKASTHGIRQPSKNHKYPKNDTSVIDDARDDENN